jgi:hypothetical protein
MLSDVRSKGLIFDSTNEDFSQSLFRRLVFGSSIFNSKFEVFNICSERTEGIVLRTFEANGFKFVSPTETVAGVELMKQIAEYLFIVESEEVGFFNGYPLLVSGEGLKRGEFLQGVYILRI